VALPIVVTGGSAGIGRAVAAALVAAGHPVIIASRHPERARLPGARLMPLDLTDRASIEGLAATVRAEDLKLAAVIANAGVWPTRRIVTRAGHELGLAVAHVGHAALIDRLAPALDDGARSSSSPRGSTPAAASRGTIWRRRAASIRWRPTPRPSSPT
jgi:NAD(P)-dependent dehydrogenase (short-subunit alcohol dehydrogenase family)